MGYSLDELLSIAREASSHASKEILKIYESEDFGIDMKSDDSPLTKADKKGHEVICSHLEKTGIPILSEEGKHTAYEERKNWERLWIVDPLDGTKEFIKRNGEFTVNISLIDNGKPIIGVVDAPVLGVQYYGISEKGGFKSTNGVEDKLNEISAFDEKKEGLKVVASRSHLNEETQSFLNKLNAPEIVSMGSSLKFMMVAEGKADIYPRFAPTMEWDTAAAHAIISAMGGRVVTPEGVELIYNKHNLLNPYFRVY
ncbi:3'(2'),5'-bisphosphate nucleotidase [Roseivirga pacifica]|uniref:3'(2'),5'-bisphosphate nucleotidase CysQ n=1 Tax=Roseivirga pacifica TaxID=1267423 RepID=A0A1I0N5B3_9BACT|nr:3'(2'),5'-bisphosphate nucleotidase CysQ [Roseivirga pacifica]RKQ50938.1 3'(2'),5'-bisphosphate nucleotidase [Roseivirga pacifica]SEV96278.1 3'(2'),5'-bisphosphate nucleotidase [Roseivirga pacifica]